ncbi:glycosyl hydrolase family 8 [Phenylobacterium sp.]|uniref:glycosyl hydrolase family 8 n=1 Tax=Phenylobacterium sp. TaxID=1871053 RepID=UPI0027319EA3|nr:glycosyl hydrolase family 8 [Phenylobacterium sp.]MDP1617995.1 glycosyl hydrolase family 8 [Phenylobacterium sp.]MDP1985650.1 glycosyl hydrolase family 8 [Phenylobacterium sp.]
MGDRPGAPRPLWTRRDALLASAGLLAGTGPPLTACARAPDAILWDVFKARFLAPDGRILDTTGGGVSHTEGQGFSMFLAVLHKDRSAFDRMWDWTQDHLARPEDELFSWRYDPRAPEPVSDPNNATDGDIFLAWALLRAGRLWNDGRYAQSSERIRTAIRRRLVVEMGGRRLLSPGLDGFRKDGFLTYNPSYFVAPALQAFQRAEPNSGWSRIIADGLAEAQAARFGPLGLPADWTRRTERGQSLLEPDRPPRFGFDALRAPFYLAWAGFRDHPQTRAAAAFWRPFLEAKTAPPAWVDLTTGELAGFRLSAGATAMACVVAGVDPLARPGGAAQEEDYYSSVLELLAYAARLDQSA